MGATCYSETSVDFQWATWHISEDSTLLSYWRLIFLNLKCVNKLYYGSQLANLLKICPVILRLLHAPKYGETGTLEFHCLPFLHDIGNPFANTGECSRDSNRWDSCTVSEFPSRTSSCRKSEFLVGGRNELHADAPVCPRDTTSRNQSRRSRQPVQCRSATLQCLEFIPTPATARGVAGRPCTPHEITNTIMRYRIA
jgi:hypothetical protein